VAKVADNITSYFIVNLSSSVSSGEHFSAKLVLAW